MGTWIQEIFCNFCSMIDKVVYWFIEQLIILFDNLAPIKIFENKQIEVIAQRLYYFITIIMIFKVSFSIIQYIINPDNFNNNEKGIGNVVKNVLIVLIAIVSVSQIFNMAYRIQDIVVENNIIPKIVFGQTNTSGSKDKLNVSQEDQKNAKREIPFLLISSFIRPNVAIEIIDYDSNGYKIKGSDTYLYKIDSGGGYSYNPSFGRSLNDYAEFNKNIICYKDGVYKRCYNFADALEHAYSNFDYSVLVDVATIKYSNNSNMFIFDYKILVSTVAGVFVAIMYLNFCIDIAIRVAKLGFLELIAPIPIISMVDPKSAKSGMMSKYIKTCINTYLGLFIRIAAVSFVVLAISLLFSRYSSGTEDGTLVKIVILFGLLMFAKQAPSLISDLTGIDMKGDFNLNPFKRVVDSTPGMKQALGAGKSIATHAAAGALGFAGGMVANGINLGKNWGNMSAKERLSNGVGLLTGGISAGARGLISKEKNPLKSAGSGIQKSVAARNLRDARQANGDGGAAGVIRRAGSNIQNWAGVDADATKFDKQIDEYSKFEDKTNHIMDTAADKMLKENGMKFINDDGNEMTIADFKADQEKLNYLSTQGMNEEEIRREAAQMKLDIDSSKLSVTERDILNSLSDDELFEFGQKPDTDNPEELRLAREAEIDQRIRSGEDIYTKYYNRAVELKQQKKQVAENEALKNNIEAVRAKKFKEIDDLRTKIAKNKDKAVDAYISYNLNGGKNSNGEQMLSKVNAVILAETEGIIREASKSTNGTINSINVNDSEGIRTLHDTVRDAKANLQNSIEYERAQVNKQNDAKK